MEITLLFLGILALTEYHHIAVNNTLMAIEACHQRNHLVVLVEIIFKLKNKSVKQAIYNHTNEGVGVLIVEFQSNKCANQIVCTGHPTSLSFS